MNFSFGRFLFASFALVVVAVAAGGCGGDDDSTNVPAVIAGETTGYRGVLVTPAIEKPSLSLSDTAGKPFDVHKETNGFLTLFYLGYTHCPDICPTHMAYIAATLKQLPQADQDKIKVVFVTTDPARDTQDVLRKWLDAYDPRFIGLVPSVDQLNQLTAAIDMPAVEKEDLGNGDYGVSHAAFVLAFTTDNLAHIVYPAGVTRDDWLADLKTLSEHGWQEP